VKEVAFFRAGQTRDIGLPILQVAAVNLGLTFQLFAAMLSIVEALLIMPNGFAPKRLELFEGKRHISERVAFQT
jgi:hypothetical protein